MDGGDLAAAERQPMASPSQTGHAVTGARQDMAPDWMFMCGPWMAVFGFFWALVQSWPAASLFEDSLHFRRESGRSLCFLCGYNLPQTLWKRVVHLLPKLTFQSRVLVKTFVSRLLVWENMHPPLHLSAEAERLHSLCPLKGPQVLHWTHFDPQIGFLSQMGEPCLVGLWWSSVCNGPDLPWLWAL